MAKTNVAVFAQTPMTTTKVLAAAVAQTGVNSISDSNNTVTNAQVLLEAGSEGAIVTKLHFQPRGTITATVAYVFLQPAGTTQSIMIDSILIPAVTMSATATGNKSVLNVSEASPLRLGAGDKLTVGISVANTVGITAYAEYTNF